jgi:hypothetical protein
MICQNLDTGANDKQHKERIEKMLQPQPEGET